MVARSQHFTCPFLAHFRQVQIGRQPDEAVAPLATAGKGERIGADLLIPALAIARRRKLPFRADAAATMLRG
jgi:hypothetical protein